MALYRVETQLISWMGSSDRLVELSKKEVKKLEAFLEKERLANRIIGSRIDLAIVRSFKDILEMYENDLVMEREMAEKK